MKILYLFVLLFIISFYPVFADNDSLQISITNETVNDVGLVYYISIINIIPNEAVEISIIQNDNDVIIDTLLVNSTSIGTVDESWLVPMNMDLGIYTISVTDGVNYNEIIFRLSGIQCEVQSCVSICLLIPNCELIEELQNTSITIQTDKTEYYTDEIISVKGVISEIDWDNDTSINYDVYHNEIIIQSGDGGILQQDGTFSFTIPTGWDFVDYVSIVTTIQNYTGSINLYYSNLPNNSNEILYGMAMDHETRITTNTNMIKENDEKDKVHMDAMMINYDDSILSLNNTVTIQNATLVDHEERVTSNLALILLHDVIIDANNSTLSIHNTSITENTNNIINVQSQIDEISEFTPVLSEPIIIDIRITTNDVTYYQGDIINVIGQSSGFGSSADIVNYTVSYGDIIVAQGTSEMDSEFNFEFNITSDWDFEGEYSIRVDILEHPATTFIYYYNVPEEAPELIRNEIRINTNDIFDINDRLDDLYDIVTSSSDTNKRIKLSNSTTDITINELHELIKAQNVIITQQQIYIDAFVISLQDTGLTISKFHPPINQTGVVP